MEKIFNLKEMEMKESGMNYSGRMMSLKDFRSYFDCTVEFDDGTVIPHANYGCFWFGNIKHPEDTWEMLPEIGQTAEVRGRNVSIVDMSSKSNVTFMFDDGKVVTGRTYRDMKRGYFGDIATERKGYQAAKEDSTLDQAPNAQRETQKAKETKAAKDMPKAVKAQDGRVYRLEGVAGDLAYVLVDGVLVGRVPCQDYLDGKIRLPKNYADKKKKIGETAVNQNGESMKIIVWRSASDIDVLVDGEPATHRTYQNFKFGKVVSDRHRNDMERRAAEKKERKANRAIISKMAKLGRVSINQMGQRMALWKYSSENNVSVIFESGSVVKTTWYAYRHGLVIDPAQEEKAKEAMKKAESRDDREQSREDIFHNRFTTASEKIAEEAIRQTAKDVWGRDRKEFMAQANDNNARRRTRDISRKLDGCATSLRMYSMTAADPIGTLLETLAKAAMNASEKLRDENVPVSSVFGEITMLAQTVRKGAEDSTGNLYLDDALKNTADLLEGLLK